MDRLVAVIILNWNGFDDTDRCLRTVLQSTYPHTLPIVVDNASTDGSYERLRAAHPDVELLQAGDNLGYAAGNNVGLRRALELGADYVFVINNDTEVPPACVGEMLTAMETDPRIGQAGPRVDDAITGRIGCVGGEIRWSVAEPRHIGEGEVDAGQYTAVADVAYVPGTAVMVRRAALDQVGLLPEHYFIYFEDAEWSLRFQAAGWRTVAVPSAAILHWESATMGHNSPRKLYYLVRNNVAFLRGWTPDELRRSAWRRFHWKLARWTARNLLRGGVAQARAMLAGYRDGRRERMWKTERTF